MLFCMALRDADDILFQTAIDTSYTVFKAQVAAANLFENQFKNFDYEEIKETWPQKMRTETDSKDDNVVHMQLQYLRAAACMKLVFMALRTGEVNG